MTIGFKCRCGRALRVKREHAGKKATCPACGQHLTIPDRSSTTPVAAVERATPRPAPPMRGPILACKCGKRLATKLEWAGKAIQCPQCRDKIRVPGTVAAAHTVPAVPPVPTLRAKTEASKKKRGRLIYALSALLVIAGAAGAYVLCRDTADARLAPGATDAGPVAQAKTESPSYIENTKDPGDTGVTPTKPGMGKERKTETTSAPIKTGIVDEPESKKSATPKTDPAADFPECDRMRLCRRGDVRRHSGRRYCEVAAGRAAQGVGGRHDGCRRQGNDRGVRHRSRRCRRCDVRSERALPRAGKASRIPSTRSCARPDPSMSPGSSAARPSA